MPSSSFKRLLLLIGGMLLCIAAQVPLFLGGDFFSTRAAHFSPVTRSAFTPMATVTTGLRVNPTPTLFVLHNHQSQFEKGIVFPQWSPTAYGFGNPEWQQGLRDISMQTGARWIEMPILFTQTSSTSTQVSTGQGTPTVESIIEGISAAQNLGYHIFIVPLIDVDNPPGIAWAASIHFSTPLEEEEWFDSYWQVLKPYIVAAEQMGVDEVAIGTELEWLQQNAPGSLWNILIARVRSVFSGTITYDMNWSSLGLTLPAWMSNPHLDMLGVSEYMPLVSTRMRVDPAEIFPLWRDTVKKALDNVAIHLGKPVLISEIGYRNSADTLYHPWFPTSTASPADPVEQAAACDAALANAISDPHIAGIFFWGWDNVGGFKLAGQPAETVLHRWYSSS